MGPAWGELRGVLNELHRILEPARAKIEAGVPTQVVTIGRILPWSSPDASIPQPVGQGTLEDRVRIGRIAPGPNGRKGPVRGRVTVAAAEL